jgi:transposase-like protein
MPSFPFHAYRNLRFPDGPRCVRCGSSRIQRWGRFSGRRRFRCLACRRTFSDFTGSALAYVKRLPAWSPYCHCLRTGLPVRVSAARAGISAATAFRWRHRILEGLARSDGASLGPVAAIDEIWFQQSEKGSRNLDRPARRRKVWYRFHATPVWVLVARDEAGGTVSEVIGLSRAQADDIVGALAARLGPDAELVSRFGYHAAPAVAADRLRLTHRTVLPVANELLSLKGYLGRLRRWMRRFRGVATRYLANYLAWHRFVDAADRSVGPRSHRWAVAALSSGCPP